MNIQKVKLSKIFIGEIDGESEVIKEVISKICSLIKIIITKN